jgi:hypothetical protein
LFRVNGERVAILLSNAFSPTEKPVPAADIARLHGRLDIFTAVRTCIVP